MNDNLTLSQLAGVITQLQQQIEQVNQRLDMIYGAVNRLTEAQTSRQAPTTGTPTDEQTGPATSTAGMSFSAHTLLDPGSMLASLHQHAVKAGLSLPYNSIAHLQAEQPAANPKGNNSP